MTVKKKAAAKKKEYKLDLFNKVLPALDRKDRDFYDNLTDDEKKELTPYTLVRWASTLGKPAWGGGSEPDPDITGYYIQSVNHYANKHLLDIPTRKDNNHTKLLWLMLTAASPGLGKQPRKFIPLKSAGNAQKTRLMNLFPNMKEDDVATLSALVTKKEIDNYVSAHGQEESKSKKRKS